MGPGEASRFFNPRQKGGEKSGNNLQRERKQPAAFRIPIERELGDQPEAKSEDLEPQP